jgi:hypothetical protein
MDHLFSSTVRVEEMKYSVTDGQASMTWHLAEHVDTDMQALLGALPCRLDLNFVRPGKDIMPAPVAGRAPDRIGVMFAAGYAPLKAGQRVVAIPNANGLMPVEGTFEIRVIPDKALDYSTAHHIEVQILETNQDLDGIWPDDDPESLVP